MGIMHRTVLVVDDDPHIRDLLVFALQKAGLATRQAADGEAALVDLKAHRSDLVILDINMPRMVFSRDAIIDRVHGPGFAMTDRTIDSHVRNLRAKFDAVGGGDVIETRAGIGYQIGPCAGGAA